MKKTLSLVSLLALAAPAAMAQSNSIPGTDVRLGLLDSGTDITVHGRVGTFPSGTNGISMSTTSCNAGSVNVPWLAAMQENHPMIAFMIVREIGGRLEQISDRSYVKHGFFALSNSQCTPCQNPSNGTFLGVGCSDTYSTGNNGDRFWLGPPQEINPWLGTWTSFGSFFDCPTGGGCDGNRSYNGGEPNSVNHRVTVDDKDLDAPTARFYYYGYYVIRGEPEANRENNGNSREFIPGFNGSSWSLATGGFSNPHVPGTILQRWTGASIDSNTNGSDDGRVYVGVVVTDLGGGQWRYEYALHNRDNFRGIDAFRLPILAGSSVSAVTFRDVDDLGNDWTFSQTATEVAWTTNNNPLRWNTVYNFGFTSDAPPATGQGATLEQFDAGAGADSFTVSTTAPGFGSPETYCTAKLNSEFCFPFLTFAGNPSASATSAFQVTSNDLVPNEVGFYIYGLNGRSSLAFHNGTLCVKAPFQRLLPAKISGSSQTPPCSGQIQVNFNNRIQSGVDPSLSVGQRVNMQLRQRDPNLGDGFNDSLTDGIEFTIQP